MQSAWTALADPHRRTVLELLRERPRPVGEIVERLGLTQPGTSKHLRVLRDAGLVTVRVDAQRRIYELNGGRLEELDVWLEPYRRLWDKHLTKLERHLDRQVDRNTPATPEEDGDARHL
jgi:DNA-binding transcriptional ArsR family regulator